MKKTDTIFKNLEENLITLIMGLMVVITFANVVVRGVFNGNILWALEMTVFLFGWLVLLGASYALKTKAHLGVDIIIHFLPAKWRRYFGLFSVTICIIFSFLLLKGAWDYWANFANLPATTGRWFPTGLETDYLSKGWYEVNDIPMPALLSWMQPIFNEGEAYEKIPRLIPYLVLPLSMALLLWRALQMAWLIFSRNEDRVIASHASEDNFDEDHTQ